MPAQKIAGGLLAGLAATVFRDDASSWLHGRRSTAAPLLGAAGSSRGVDGHAVYGVAVGRLLAAGERGR